MPTLLAEAAAASAVLDNRGAVTLTTLTAPGGAGKVRTLLHLSDCPAGADQPLGFTENPGGVELGPSPRRLLRESLGASVANTLIVFPGAVAVHLVVAVLAWIGMSHAEGHRASLHRAMDLVLFPGWQVLPLLFFYQGTAESALRVVYYGSGWTKVPAVAVVAVLFCALPYALHRVTKREVSRAELVRYERQNTPLRRALFGKYTWVCGENKGFVGGYGMMFWDYTQRHSSLLLFEVAGIAGLSLIGAYRPTDRATCLLKASSVAFLFAARVALIAVWKPFIALYDFVMFLFLTACELTAAVFAVIIIAQQVPGPRGPTGAGGAERIAAVAVTAAVAGLAAKTLGDFLLFSFELWEDLRARARRRRGDKRFPTKRHIHGDPDSKDATYIDMTSDRSATTTSGTGSELEHTVTRASPMSEHRTVPAMPAALTLLSQSPAHRKSPPTMATTPTQGMAATTHAVPGAATPHPDPVTRLLRAGPRSRSHHGQWRARGRSASLTAPADGEEGRGEGAAEKGPLLARILAGAHPPPPDRSGTSPLVAAAAAGADRRTPLLTQQAATPSGFASPRRVMISPLGHPVALARGRGGMQRCTPPPTLQRPASGVFHSTIAESGSSFRLCPASADVRPSTPLPRRAAATPRRLVRNIAPPPAQLRQWGGDAGTGQV